MRTFTVTTLGCKVNQYEAQQVRELLEQLGLQSAGPHDKADLVVVNTCCVTHVASAKSRQYIRRSLKQDPDVVVVCGCLPSVETGELNIASPKTRIVKDRRQLANELREIVACQDLGATRVSGECLSPGSTCELPPLTSFEGHTRAFLKVQDGCDGYCTYCIVPKTRPAVQSKPLDHVVAEARALVAAGHKEIVVTGVFLGAYGQTTVRRKNWINSRDNDLPGLLDSLARLPGLARIRLSSLEPADVTPTLIEVFCRHSNIMPHLHLSLQSGSDAILRRMCRQYCVEEFIDRVHMLKSALDRPAITTDIIVGFPGETDEDFRQTFDLARHVGFAKMHVFGFSPRKGTAAAKMTPVVPPAIIKQRAHLLQQLGMDLAGHFRQQFVGQATQVLLENQNGRLAGRSERYFMVHLDPTPSHVKRNDLLRVTLIANAYDHVIGRPADACT
jgi:threonylcarbamoyladenosine tRNA methylthiotransferase MtaB